VESVIASALRTARKLIILVIGGTVVLFGIALIVLPGPAFVVIPIGLAILAVEFAWAKALLDRVKAHLASAKNSVFGSTPPSSPPPV
jgi:tellurite resistance protein TerC